MIFYSICTLHLLTIITRLYQVQVAGPHFDFEVSNMVNHLYMIIATFIRFTTAIWDTLEGGGGIVTSPSIETHIKENLYSFEVLMKTRVDNSASPFKHKNPEFRVETS